MNWLKSLFRHRHRWKTTHTNRWMIPTVQVCKCGMTREVEIADKPLEYHWRYSDGSVSQDFDLGQGVDGITSG